MIFLRVLSKIFMWPHYSGAPGARGPRFIESPEPPVPTPLCSSAVEGVKPAVLLIALRGGAQNDQ